MRLTNVRTCLTVCGDLPAFFQPGAELVYVMNGQFGDAFHSQRRSDVKVEADTIILDGTIGTFGFLNRLHNLLKLYRDSSAIFAARAAARFFFIGGVLPLHAQSTDAGGFGGGHVVAVLSAGFLLDELPLFAVSNVIDLFQPVPC